MLFEAVDVCGNGDKDISLKIHRGEVLGLGGLVGAGRTEFSELMFGMREKTSGKFYFKGKEINQNHREKPLILELDWFRRIEKQKEHFLD